MLFKYDEISNLKITNEWLRNYFYRATQFFIKEKIDLQLRDFKYCNELVNYIDELLGILEIEQRQISEIEIIEIKKILNNSALEIEGFYKAKHEIVMNYLKNVLEEKIKANEFKMKLKENNVEIEEELGDLLEDYSKANGNEEYRTYLRDKVIKMLESKLRP